MDPDGQFVVLTVAAKVFSGAVIGAAVGAITNVAIQVGANLIRNGGDLKSAVNNIDTKSVLTSALSGAITGAITGGLGEVSTAYNALREVKAIVNAGANVAGTTVGTITDNIAHEKPLTKNLVRNNVIAALAGGASAYVTTPANGTVVGKNGQKTNIWIESLDSTGRITSLTTCQPIDVTVNNFAKEFGVTSTQTFISTVVAE